MAVAKKCDKCGKYYEATQENLYSYEENGERFFVDSIRLGKWNARTKSWDNIVSAYDLCKDCARKMAEAVLGDGDLTTRKVIKPAYDPNFKKREAAGENKEGEEE